MQHAAGFARGMHNAGNLSSSSSSVSTIVIVASVISVCVIVSVRQRRIQNHIGYRSKVFAFTGNILVGGDEEC
jgi:hypothetical protein